MKRFALFAALFFIALLPRLAFILLVPYRGPGGDEVGYDNLAWSLAQGKGFVDESGNPTSFYFPVYPYFVSFIYRIFGHAYFPVFFAQALLSASLCVMVFVFTRGLFGRKTSALAYVISVIYPSLIFCTQNLLVNCLFAFLFFSFFTALWKSYSSEKILYFGFSGILLGGCALTRGEALFFLPAFALFYACTKNTKKLFNKNHLLPFILLAASLLPWSIRNTFAHKNFIPLSTRGGITLYNSFFIAERGFSFNQVRNAGKQYYRLKTEVEKDRYLTRKALLYIVRHPVKVLALVPVKVAHLLYPFDGQWYSVSLLSKFNIFFGLVFAFSIPGMIFLYLKKQDIFFFFALPLLTIIFSSSVFYGKPWYRIPIEPYLIIACSYCVVLWLSEKPLTRTFTRKILPVTALNLLLFFFADSITMFLRQLLSALLGVYPKG